jgi:hypothetical protein
VTVALIIMGYLAIVLFTLGLVGATRRSKDRGLGSDDLALNGSSRTAHANRISRSGTGHH